MSRGQYSSTTHKYLNASTNPLDYLDAGYTDEKATREWRRAWRARESQETALRFRVELSTLSEPRIWREIRVPNNITFHKFHKVLQIAFGWSNRHAYEFHVEDSDEVRTTIAERHNIAESRDMDLPGEYHTSITRLSRVFGNADFSSANAAYNYVRYHSDSSKAISQQH